MLSISEISNELSVSTATVSNWIKSGVLPSNIDSESIVSIKNNLLINSTKLTSRANKRNSSKIFIPLEYLNDSSVVFLFESIVSLYVESNHSAIKFLDSIIIAYLASKGEITLSNNTYSYKRMAIQKELSNNHSDSYYVQLLLDLFNRNNTSNVTDVLGLCYQSINSEGDKSSSGSYYTPHQIVSDSFINLGLTSSSRFLDPCCGSGSFILSAIDLHNIQFENIYGADLDSSAVKLTKLNILLAFPLIDKTPNIYCLDALNDLANGNVFCESNFLLSSIDVIATNPPWGASKNSLDYHNYVEILSSKEIFSMFIYKSMQLLSKNGKASFILPVSFLNVKSHNVIRKHLASNSTIISIDLLDRAFTGVYTKVFRLVFSKEIVSNNKTNISLHDGSTYQIFQSRFLSNKSTVYDVNTNNVDELILSKIFSTDHFTLKGNSKWALGIVTGDNKSHIQDYSSTNTEPIYKGSCILPFQLKKPQHFIQFERKKFQQVAKDEFYRAKEKLVYKFISNKLVFAYDNQQSLTLNSANILIPLIPNYSIKVVVALLNSSLFQFIFLKKFSTHKILKSDLEQLPFPILSDNIHTEIERLSSNIIIGDTDLIDKVNNIVFKIFNLESCEINHIKTNLKN